MTKEIDTSQYEYIPDSELPVLVLGIYVYSHYGERHKMRGRDWKKIAHQTAGNACHSHYIVGTILEPKPELKTKIDMLNKCWLDSNCGVFGVSLDEILKYREQLRDLFGVDCNSSYDHFEEALYPIDCNRNSIEAMTNEELPEELDDFIDFKSPADKMIGCINRWSLFILGENCD